MRLLGFRGLHIALAAVALALGTGCYRYEPLESPQPGMDVRARLHTEAAVRRSAGMDEPIMFMNGRVIAATAESLLLDVLVVRDPSVFTNIEIRDTVNLARHEIQTIAARRISTSRSVLFAGALGVGAFLVVRGISAIIGGNEGENGDPGPIFDTAPVSRTAAPTRTIPLLRIPLPR